MRRGCSFCAFGQGETRQIPIEGDLISVTKPAVTGTPTDNDFPVGKTTRYTYTQPMFSNAQQAHKLVSIIDAKGQEFVRNTYQLSQPRPRDLTGDGCFTEIDLFRLPEYVSNIRYRVVSQVWGNPGEVLTFAYGKAIPVAANNFAVRYTEVIDRVSNITVHLYDKPNRLVSKRERLRGLRPNDPGSFSKRYEYNEDSKQKRIIEPNGNISDYVYELELNPEAMPSSHGNVREVHHLPGTHSPVGDQAEIVDLFEYDTGKGSCCGSNFVTKYTDGRGNVTRHEYDDHGNRIRTIHAIPSIIEGWEYNAFGQMTAHILPDNGTGHRRRDEYSYYDSGPQRGYLKDMIVDASGFALTTTYEYDAVGNVVRKFDPKGNDTQYIVNALNQVVREISRDVGGGVRYHRDYFYDANDNLVRVDVQNVDESGQVHENEYLTTVIEYEILNEPVRICREVGNYGESIPGTTNHPTCDGLPSSEFIVTEFEYDANRNRTAIRSPEAVAGTQPGNITRIRYDERDLPFRIIRGEGTASQSTVQFDYDGNRNLVAVREGIESEPRVTTYTYDGFDRRVEAMDAMGNLVDYDYDAAGNLIEQLVFGELVDAPGDEANVRLSQTSHEYDAKNRRIRSERGFFDAESQSPLHDGVSAVTMTYADTSRLLNVTNDNNHTTAFAYDSANRLQSATDAKGNTRTYGYDANSNVVAITEVDKSDLGAPDETFPTTLGYDGLDRRVQVVNNLGHTHTFRHDSRNNQAEYVDAKGNVVRQTFDGLNRPLSTIRLMTDTGDGGGVVVGDITTRQSWDKNSRVRSRTDDNGNATRYTYDELNRLVVETMADGTASVYTFDVHDNRVGTVDANGTMVTGEYDLLDRLKGITVQPAPGVQGTTFEAYRYDGLSRLIRAENDDSIVARAYDSLSNIVLEKQNGQSISAVFDGLGNMLSCIYPSGRTIINTFDELERKSAVADADGLIASYAFVGPGRVAQRDYGNNARLSYAYDGIKRIVATTHAFDPGGANEVLDPEQA